MIITTQETTPSTLEPNLFELQGYDLQVTYSTSSFTGEPLFTFTTHNQNLNFSGSEIQVEDTKLGRIVTVMLKNNLVDEGFESLTLLLPMVFLAEGSRTSTIQTEVIFSKKPGFVVPTPTGQLQTYQTLSVFGTAQRVEF
ncbi:MULTISPECIES: hypothetical protein [Nostocales]|uniref:Uncharacterized protein n=3 Tax=Nostocales TaxID=1161 RepID=A0A0C1N3Y9_9CYAN|nr:hypothetical protein [Tolypothrix bouteillei]KAF3889396.1 hypothetical protein DA73_0400030880 [Tolypothrix bouteillei VB521301]